MSELAGDSLEDALVRCGGSPGWASAVLGQAPFRDSASLLRAADSAWDGLDDAGWTAALAAHAEEKVPPGAEETRRAAQVALRLYRERFGIPFVSAVHSPVADELLMRVRIRLGNDEAAEVRAAREELRRAMRHRLERIWAERA